MFSEQSRELIASCLDRVAMGDVFPNWEVGLLLGFECEELPALATQWRTGAYDSEMIRAGHSVLGNLSGYPMDKRERVLEELGTTRGELERLLEVFLEYEGART